MYAIRDSANSTDTTIPSISTLREKYTYNVCPWAYTIEESELSSKKRCPPPSCGGSLSVREVQHSKPVHKIQPENNSIKTTLSYFQRNYTRNGPAMAQQIKVLREHYSSTARQPQSVHCNMSLVPPQARIVCPQAKKAIISPDNKVLSYAADVPDAVLERSQFLSGYHCLEELQEVKKKVFTISYNQPNMEELICIGKDQSDGQISDKKRRSQTKEEDWFIRRTIGHSLP